MPDARFPATLPAISGANLTNLDASDLASGTVPDARFPATLPAISGANLTNLDASDLASGTVPIARIDLNLLTTSTADGDGDFFVVVDSVGAEKKLTKANINISGFNNDSGFTTNTGTVTSVSGGDGLTGSVTTSGSLAVGAGTLIDVTADAVNVDLSELATSTSDADGDFFAVVDAANAQKKLTKGNIAISGFNNDSGFIDGSSLNASNLDSGTVPNARLSSIPNSALANSAITINGSSTSLGGSINVGDITGVTAGTLLDGGGTSGDVTLNVDLSELTTSTSDADGDFFAVVDAANAQKKLTKANINISGFNNDSGFTTNTGTVTSVSGGNGLTGSVTTSGSLAVGAGTGINVTADAVAVDVSDFMTNGSNNRVVTATGTAAMNAEANLIFDGSKLGVGVTPAFPLNVATPSVDGVNTLFGAAASATGAGTYIGFADSDATAVIGVYYSNVAYPVIEITRSTRATSIDADLSVSGNVTPGANDTYDLGASGNVWRNLYTGDLHLSNEAKSEGNAIDGTKGNWTIQEGENDLYILNNKSGKKYKFKLEEI